MSQMSLAVRKLTLAVHVVSSVGWFGSVAAFLALAVAGIAATDPTTARAPYTVMGLVAWFVISPLCLASLLTGIGLSLGATSGLVRRYWVLIKVLMIVPATVLLLFHMRPINLISTASTSATFSPHKLGGLRVQMVANAAAVLLVLAVATVLSVYKPQGRTRFRDSAVL